MWFTNLEFTKVQKESKTWIFKKCKNTQKTIESSSPVFSQKIFCVLNMFWFFANSDFVFYCFFWILIPKSYSSPYNGLLIVWLPKEKIPILTWLVKQILFFFDFFSNFSKSFRSFRSFENLSENRSRRDDSFGPKTVKIGAILAIFRPFEIFQKNHFPGLWIT